MDDLDAVVAIRLWKVLMRADLAYERQESYSYFNAYAAVIIWPPNSRNYHFYTRYVPSSREKTLCWRAMSLFQDMLMIPNVVQTRPSQFGCHQIYEASMNVRSYTDNGEL